MGCGQARTLGGSFPDALPSPMVADGVFSGWLCAWMTDDGVVAAAGMARIHILSCQLAVADGGVDNGWSKGFLYLV
ncbi:hypothetical protein BDA96_01G297900 [Sorghum bicolor]|uniref:Uncharacterized protein n=1 Tax=Sorghum bicolor TaxID=4558 RepID=A0A921S0M4_SORBI|nr:hypothetical protein BDA96_01G297900 [Sorghum bicolor]